MIKKGEIIQLQIEDLAWGGKGIAKVDGMVVFVPSTLPGQRVEARIVKKRKGHAEGKLLKVIKYSSDEVENEYQPIPGAPYAKLPIEKQEAYKKQMVIDLFERIGKVDIIPLLDEFISSPSTWHYRNKMEYSFSDLVSELGTGEESKGFALGFKRRGQWWAVENMEKDSGLFDQQFENGVASLRDWCMKTGLSAWSPRENDGFFRFLVVRKSFTEDRLLVNLITTSGDFDEKGFISELQNILGERLAGVWRTINDDRGERSTGGDSALIYGDEKVTERLLGLDFEMSMESFFQTNPAAAERLYSKVIEYVSQCTKEEDGVILDLFCGTGTIGQLIGSKLPNARIVGVDIVEQAIEDAKKNAERNKVSNAEFVAGDVGKFLREHPEYENKIETLVLDPPRSGIAPKTLLKVMNLQAKNIVYVSCNPATQARDAEVLSEHGYKLQKITMVDQFPHTSHVETICIFGLQR